LARWHELSDLIRSRPAGTSPAAAIRDFVLQTVSAIRDMPSEIARLQGIALGGVFQNIISDTGRHTREGRPPAETADALYPEI